MGITLFVEIMMIIGNSIGIRRGAKRSGGRTVLVTLVACGSLSHTAGAATDFELNLELGAIRSDNIFLGSEGSEQSETIYTIIPEFYFTSDNPRLLADVRYQPQAIFYSKFDESNEVFHVLDAGLTAGLMRDRLFVELNATNFQTITEPEDRIPSGNISLSGNRTDVRVLQASPYWKQKIGQTDLLIRGTYTGYDYDDDSLQSSSTSDGYFELGNIESQQGFAWQLDYQYRRTEYDISTPWEFQRAALNLGAWIDDSTRLFVVGGAETAFDNIYESNMDAGFWEAGFQYTPNQRLNLELAAGDRSYGASFRGNLSYDLKRGRLSADYSDGPYNRSDLIMDRNPLEPSEDLDGALDRPGESDRFIRKRGEISASIELAKSELTLRFFSETREERTKAGGQPLDDEEFTGISASWSWQFGRKMTLGIGGDIADRNYSGYDDEIRRARLDLEYRLSDKFGLRAEVERFDQEGNVSADSDYTENQFRFFVNASF